MRRFSVICLILCFGTLIAQDLMVPHLTAPGAGFTTVVSIHNHEDRQVVWRLFPYAGDGTALGEVSGTLAPRASFKVAASELLPDGTSHFLVDETSTQVSVNVAYRNAEGRGSPAHVSATYQRHTAVRFLPGNWDVVFDGLAVVNTGASATDIEVVQFGFNGQERSRLVAIGGLAPNAKGLFVVGAPDGSPFSSGDDTYFEVRGDAEFAIVALRGTPPGSEIGYLWENPVLANTNFHDLDLMMTHLTRPGGGFSTEIIVHNQTMDSQSFTLIPYTQDGQELQAVSRSISRNQTLALSPEDLLGQSDVSHFKIERSSRDLCLVAAYAPDGLGSPAHVVASARAGTSWSVSPGDWQEVFDGFAVVNLGQKPTDVYIHQLSPVDAIQPDAIVACEKILTDLAPNAKGLFVLGGPNATPLFDITPDTRFRIFSPMPLSVVPLRGSVPGSALNVLWPNQAFRLLHLNVSQNPLCDPKEDQVYFADAPYASHTRGVLLEANKDEPIPQVGIEVKFVEVHNSSLQEMSLEWTTQTQEGTVTLPTLLRPQTTTALPIQIPETESTMVTVNTVFETPFITREFSFPSSVAAGRGTQRLWNDLSHPDRPYLNRAVPIQGQIPSLGEIVIWQSPLFQSIPGFRQEIDSSGGRRELLIFVRPSIVERTDEKRKVPVLETLLPCGESEYGLVLCPDTPVGYEGNEFLFVYESVRAPIPVNDPDHYYQYGIVFDSDGSPNNNWVPDPAFPGDVYQGTDQWYSAEYTPLGGWELKASHIVAGNIVPMASDARMIIAEESLVLIVPKSEFEVDNPGYRVTSYEHMGDYGNVNPWSGDVHPPVDEPLARLD